VRGHWRLTENRRARRFFEQKDSKASKNICSVLTWSALGVTGYDVTQLREQAGGFLANVNSLSPSVQKIFAPFLFNALFVQQKATSSVPLRTFDCASNGNLKRIANLRSSGKPKDVRKDMT